MTAKKKVTAHQFANLLEKLTSVPLEDLIAALRQMQDIALADIVPARTSKTQPAPDIDELIRQVPKWSKEEAAQQLDLLRRDYLVALCRQLNLLVSSKANKTILIQHILSHFFESENGTNPIAELAKTLPTLGKEEVSTQLDALTQRELLLLRRQLNISKGPNERKPTLIKQILWHLFEAQDTLEGVRTYREKQTIP